MDRIVEYLCEPLARALRDDDPYVRKTAAVCVAKLYDISPVRAGFFFCVYATTHLFDLPMT